SMKTGTKEPGDCGSELARDPGRGLRGHASLRLRRWSATGIAYFVTFWPAGRRKALTVPPLMDFECERDAMETDGVWRVRAWVIKPDHVHLLMALGSMLPLARAIARFKGKTAKALRAAALAGQSGYFEHRPRTIDELRPILYYLLMNPVRAGLSERGEAWSGFYRCGEDWAWFGDYAREAVTEPGWLARADRDASKLAPTAEENRA
ncbi:MAG TPA: transposase, partial [Opitutus sp.]|nr:transposase [Opitutus sp.]